MLTHIHIQNYRLVEKLDLEFNSGLNILSGETGAGKSILIDAVNLALGARIDNQVVRLGTNQCNIALTFDLKHIPHARNWLAEQQLEEEDFCIIRRTIQTDGRSRSTINGTPCSQLLIRQFGQYVLHLYGQHEHQTLLKQEYQELSLDNFANNESLLNKILEQEKNWHQLEAKKDNLKKQERENEIELLQSQFDELTKLDLKENEWESLTQEHKNFHQNQDVLQHVNEACLHLNSDHSQSLLPKLQHVLMQVHAIKLDHTQLNNAKTLLDSAMIYLKEALEELNNYQNKIELNTTPIAALEERLSKLHHLSRKHRCKPEELLEIKNQLENKMTDLNNLENVILMIEKQQMEILRSYQTNAEQLSQSRKKFGERLSQLITEKIQQLGMKKAEFKVELSPLDLPISKHGNEKINFLISTNPGHDFHPLQKIVSGGELSRIGLALQVITHEKNNIPTLIFDEVDTGIGGGTAEIVGQLLRTLGESRQVFCITHLPQVAAQGHHHFKVEKEIQQDTTQTAIYSLDEKMRIEELARMLGGTKITEQTRAHAKEMLCIS